MRSIHTWFFIILQFIVPKLLLTNIIYRITRLEKIVLKNYLIKNFIKIYDVNIQEIKTTDLTQFKSFNAFFTRELHINARTISKEDNVIISPADGKLSAFGDIQNNQLFQAKGHHYSLQELVGNNHPNINQFIDGAFATIYLAPFNYHRVHAPLDATLTKMHYIPGNLFSVNQITTSRIPKLFIRNERLVCFFETSNSEMILIFVGALNVGSITTPWTNEIRPSQRGEIVELQLAKNISTHINKGDLLGWFNMGSTVITLFPKNTCHWSEDIESDGHIKMGNKLGSIIHHSK